jgi:predicted ATPase
MRIRSLKLENYRGFRDATLDLDRPLTVLVGINGSGKSSVLMAIATVCSEIVRENVREYLYSWSFEDVDLRAGAELLAVTVDAANGEVRQTVRADHRRGQAKPSTSIADVGQNVGGVWVPVQRYAPVYTAAPFLPVFYIATRSVAHGTRAFEALGPSETPRARADIYDALDPSESDGIAFGSLFRWFKDREDVENEAKVAQQDLKLEDPQLRSVRLAVAGMLPGFSGLRVQRDPLHMIVRKGEQVLALDQLSDGEKLLLAMTADLARRLAIANPDSDDPLAGEALVLIDEIELHLHVGWQRAALVRLRKTFPGCQFIVTTHSPQVLSTVPGDAILLLDDFRVVHPGVPTEGRDSNAILREVLGIKERPDDVVEEVRRIDSLLDGGERAEAAGAIATLERKLGWHDDEVIRLKTRLEFLETPLADDELPGAAIP